MNSKEKTRVVLHRAAKVGSSSRLVRAFGYAAKLHATQKRKGTVRPYIAHLLGVASIVLDHGGDEDQAIAALLHDALEDQGDKTSLKEIRRRFGRRVAEIVEGCTDTQEYPKPPWRPRKEAFLAHIAQAPAHIRLVCAADKLHNAREILADYRRLGNALGKRFNAPEGMKDVLLHYRALVVAFRRGGSNPLIEELDRVVSELEQLARRN